MRMTKVKAHQILKTISFCILLMCTINCFYFTDPLRKAKKALKKEDCKKSREFLSYSQKEDLEFALKAAQICENESILESAWFYKYLSEREKIKEKRYFFKEKLAEIYFEKLKDYEEAFSLWFFLREQTPQIDKKLLYSYKIANCFFEMQKWKESLLEINKYLKISTDSSFHKNFLFLKGRVLLMQKQFEQSAQIFRHIQIQYPQFFQDQDIYWYLSFIYESQKDFQQAIRELKKFQYSSEFLKNKIDRLKKRDKNLPARPLDLKSPGLQREEL